MADLTNEFPAFPYPLSPVAADAIRRFRAVGAPTPVAPAAPAEAKPNSVLTDIGHGLAGGAMVDLPKMAGQAMQAFGIGADTGKQMEDAATARESDPLYQTTGAWGAGARGVAPALATIGAGALAIPLGTTAVAAAGAGAAGALFGGSAYQDMLERSLKAGASPEAAHDAALKAGGIMGVGQAAAAAVGGKVLAGGAGALADAFVKKGAVANALESFVNPSALGQFGKGFAEMMGVQLPVQAGTAAAMNQVEQDAGIKTEKTNWQAAKDSLAPTAAMTTLLAPVGAFGARQTVAHREAIAATVSGDRFKPEEIATDDSKQDRTRALQEMARHMRKVAPRDEVVAWQNEALRAINDGAKVDLRNPDFNYDQAKAEAAQTKQLADEQAAFERAQAQGVEQIQAAPAPDEVEHIEAAPPPDTQGETIEMGSEAGARHERMVENRQVIRDRIAENQAKAIDVTEPTVEHIDVHGVNEEKGGRGNQPSAEDVATRLQAAKTEPGPEQGTARLLGLPVDSAIVRDAGINGTKVDTTESRVKALRSELPGVKSPLLTKLAKVSPQDLPEMIRAEWSSRGGEGAKTGVAEKLGTLYEKITGQKIGIKQIEVPNEQHRATAEAPVNEAKGAEPQRSEAAGVAEDSTRAGQVPQAEGNAAARATPVADEKANGGGKAEAIVEGYTRTPQDAAIGEARNKAALATVLAKHKMPEGYAPKPWERQAAIDVGGRMIEDRRKQNTPVAEERRGQPIVEKGAKALAAPELDAVFPKPSASARKADTALAKLTAHRDKAQGLLDQHKQLVQDQVKAPTKERAKKIEKLETQISESRFTEQELQQAHRDAAARATQDVATADPAARAKPVDRVRELARKMAKDEAIDTAEKTVSKQARTHVETEARDHAESQAAVDALDEKLASSEITPEQHEIETLKAMAAAADRAGTKNRGLAGLADDRLASVVSNGTTTTMEHIGRTHANPTVRMVAKVLARANPNAKIEVIENPDFNGGRYNPSTHTIEIGRGGMNAVTLMHETSHSLTHAALYRAIVNDRLPAESLTARAKTEVAALKTIGDIMDKFAAIADRNNPEHTLALQDEHEFLAEAINNPDIQQMLGGRSGLMTRVYNAVADVIGLPAAQRTDFERLMQVTPQLFGSPNRGLSAIFHSALDRAATPDSPRGKVIAFQKIGQQLSQAALGREADVKRPLREKTLYMTSVNHASQMLDRVISNYAEQFKQHAAILKRVGDAFRGPKAVIEARGAQAQHLNNAPMESNAHMAEMQKALKADKGAFKKMTELAMRARQAGVDPRDRTLADAQKRNPEMTAAVFNSDLAKKVRADWNGIKDTASGSTYEHLRTFSELGLARHYATQFDNIRAAFGLARDPSLNWWAHIQGADGRSELVPQHQLDKLNSAVARTLGEANAHADADFKATVHALHNEFQRQRAQPYVHFGRTGDYMIHFEVRPEFYEQVRKIVTTDRKDGGLERDMGPDTGNHTVDMRFESDVQHAYAVQQLKALYDQGAFKLDHEEGVRDTWAAGTIVDRFTKTDGATPMFIQKLKARIDDMKGVDADTKLHMIREIHDAHLQMMPESSPLKAQMFADLAQGASKDFVESWGKRQTMANHSLVGATSAMRMGDAIADMSKAMQAVREAGPDLVPAANHLASYENEMKQRVNDMQIAVNTPTFDFMRAVAAPFRLALSPAYLAMTAYQPMQMTLPYLGGEHGYIRSALAMAGAYGKSWGALNFLFKNAWDINKGTSNWKRLLATAQPTVDLSRVKNKDGTFMFNGAEKELMDHLQYSNLINFGQTQQIVRPRDTTGAPAALGKVGEANTIASIFPHHVEMMNRMVSALAAHELFLTKGKKFANEAAKQAFMDAAPPEQRELARKYAMGMIRNTDGDHSQGNIARGLGRRGLAKGATPLIVGFNQYDFQMFESLARTTLKAINGPERKVAAKQLAGVFAMTAVMAGTLGMPLMGLFSALYNRIGSAFQDDGDTPPDFEKGWRDAMTGIFGEKGGELVSRGLPRALDIDMSNRSGYQDLAPFTEFLASRAKLGDAIKDNALNFLGPAVGVGVGIANGAREAYEGNYLMAANDALPAFARNAYKAYRMSQYGYERQSGANELIPLPMSSWNVVAQAGGFTSGTKAEESEKQQQWSVNQDVMKSRLGITRNKWLRGMDHDDPQAVGEAMQDVIKFAIQQPQMAGAPGGLADAYRQRMTDMFLSAQTGGVRSSKKQLPFLQMFQNGGLPTL